MGNPRSDLAPGEATAVNTIAYVLGSLSFLGSAFIVACFLAFKSRRTFGFRLVFLLSLNDAASQFRIIVQGLKVALGDGSPWSYLTSYFELACVLWTMAIAFTLHHAVLLHKDLHRVSRWMPRYIAFCQGIPAAACLVVQAFDAFGDAGAWCWIRAGGTRNDVLRFATFYAPCWIAILYNASVYGRVRLALTEARDPLAPNALRLRAASAAGGVPPGGAPDYGGIVDATRTDPLRPSSGEGSEAPHSWHAGQRGWVFGGSEPRAAGSADPARKPPSAAYSEGPGRHSPRFVSADGSCLYNDAEEEDVGVIEEPSERGPHRALTEVARIRQERTRQLSRRLIMYPAILAVCWTWATVNRTQNLFSRENVFWLWILHATFANMQGLLNSIAYGLTDGVQDELRQRWRDLCGNNARHRGRGKDPVPRPRQQ